MSERRGPYEAVLWDVGGVIIELKSIREGYAAFVGELAERHGLDPETALSTWREVLGEHFRSREGTVYETAHEGYRKATHALFDDPPAEEEWLPLLEEYTRSSVRTEPGVLEVLRALDDAGFYLGVVSDVDDHELERLFEGFDLGRHFDDVTTSEAVGYRKPDPRMFETAVGKLREAGYVPDETLMVGDRYRHDVEGAREAGLVPVGYRADAHGEAAAYEITDHRELLDIVGLETDYVEGS
jgi:putative hydrolase of the HAD superfamily